MQIQKRPAIGAFFRRNIKKIITCLAILLLLSFVTNISFKTILVMLLLILAASFSTFYFNYFTAPVNFELVKLATILAAVSYGLLPGLAVGVISTFAGKALIGRVDEKLPFSMLTISLVAVAAWLFSSANIAVLGIILVGIYNLTLLVMTQVLGGSLAWNLPYEGTDFLFNLFLFSKLAPLLLRMIK